MNYTIDCNIKEFVFQNILKLISYKSCKMSSGLLSSELFDPVECFRDAENKELTSDLPWKQQPLPKEKSLPRSVTEFKAELLDLPEEILYQIFSYLSVDDLLLKVKTVCKCFNQMLTDTYFKRRILKMLNVNECPRALRAMDVGCGERPKSWMYACLMYEQEFENWSSSKFDQISRFDFSGNTSSVDVVKILGDGRLLMCGGRDRILSLWNVQKSPRQLAFNQKFHTGWIWDVIPFDSESALSCDWDGKIGKWAFETCLKDPDCTFDIGRPILSLSARSDLLVAGLQTGEICLLDPRANPAESSNKRVHRSAVMGVELIGTNVVTIGEDKILSVFDLRNKQQVKKSRISGQAIPVSMCKIRSGLYVAQTNGSVTLINTSTFKIWQVFSSNDSRLTCINASKLGSVVTSSRDAHVTVYRPGKTLHLLRSIKIDSEVAKVDYNRGILAIARSDNKVTVFNTNIRND